MAVLYRSLPSGFFRSAVILHSKWAWSKPPIQLGRNCLSKSAAASACYDDPDPKSQVRYVTTKYIPKNTESEEENEVYSFLYDEDFAKPPKKSFATKKQFSHRKKQMHQNRVSAGVSNRSFDDIEAYDTKQDPRGFQQCRPEYKSMCFSMEGPVETAIEESVRILAEDTRSLTSREVAERLIKISYLPKKELMAIVLKRQFKNLYKHSTSNFPLYTDSELVSILGAFARFNIHANLTLPQKYEQQICHRARHLPTNDLLLVADTFRYMGLKVSKFLDIMYNCMEQRYVKLNLQQVVKLTYIIGEARYAPPGLMEKIETVVLRCISTIHVEEIGAVCLGFFKSKNGFSQPLMTQFGTIVLERMKQISNYSLVSVLKMYRFTRAYHLEFFEKVGQEADKRIPEMSVQGIMHVVLAFASMHILNKELMDAVAMAIPQRLFYCRSKDIAKYLWSFGILKYEPPNADVFYSSFTDEIQRNLKEFMDYPEHFLTCLMGLAFCQQFPLDLINIALSRSFIDKASKSSSFELRKDILTIAGTVKIECPQYNGNMVSAKFCQEVEDLIKDFSGLNIHTKILVTRTGLLLAQLLGGPEYVKEHMILPHTRVKDFEVHFDINRKPVAFTSAGEVLDPSLFKPGKIEITNDLLLQLTSKSKMTPTSSMKNCLDENEKPVGDLPMRNCSQEKTVVTKLAIQVTNRNQYLLGSQELLGFHFLKRRQLRKLGYVVLEIPYWEWFPLQDHTTAEKLSYLHNKVFNSF